MRIVGHPAVLALVLLGLLMWAWSIVAIVPSWQWLTWLAVTGAVAAFVGRRDLVRALHRLLPTIEARIESVVPVAITRGRRATHREAA